MAMSFLQRVSLAVHKVTEKYPTAKFINATGQTSSGMYVSDPALIDELQVVFYLPNQPKFTTVLIQSTGPETFGEPEVIPEMWVEDRIWERWAVTMDAPEACVLKQRAGYTSQFHILILRHILNPEVSNPYLIFVQEDRKSVAVDTITRKVLVIGTGDEA